MKKFLLISTIFLSLTITHGQNCIANFGYTIGTNNLVTIYDSSTSSCTLYVEYNYGDPQSGELNSSNWIFYSTSGFQHFYKNAGTYTICQYIFTGTSCTNPCLDTICKQITLPNNGSNCEALYSFTSTGLSCSFSNLSSADDTITNVSWNFGDPSPASNLYYPNHTYVAQGNYTVCLYIQTNNGCQSYTCDTLTVNQNGINEYATHKFFTISPNPFCTQTDLHTDKVFKDATLTVYNLYGQQVKQIKNISGQTITLHRDNLTSGIYLVRLMTQNNIILTTNKLVITD